MGGDAVRDNNTWCAGKILALKTMHGSRDLSSKNAKRLMHGWQGRI